MKKTIVSLIIIIMIISNIFTYSYAENKIALGDKNDKIVEENKDAIPAEKEENKDTIPVEKEESDNLSSESKITTEKLTESLNKMVAEAKKVDINIEILKVNEKNIELKSEGIKYIMDYDLTEPQAIFNLDIMVDNKIIYDTFEKNQNDIITIPVMTYAAVVNTQGIEIEDGYTYIMAEILKSIFTDKDISSNKNNFTIIDDRGGNTVQAEGENEILASKFGEKAVEYVTAVYGKEMILDDSKDGLNTYKLRIGQADKKENSCKIKSTLEVNMNADFSKLKGAKQRMEMAMPNKDITPENADYNIELKVGQKCVITSNKAMGEKNLSGAKRNTNVKDNKTIELVFENEGVANGYIKSGTEKKTVYFTIKPNENNEVLEPKEIKMEFKEEDIKTPEVEKPNNNKNVIQDNTVSNNRIPNAGYKTIIPISIVFSIIALIVFKIGFNRYKDIK